MEFISETQTCIYCVDSLDFLDLIVISCATRCFIIIIYVTAEKIIIIMTMTMLTLPNRCWPLRGWKTRPTEEDGQIGTNPSLPLERGALFNRFFGKPAHGPPHVAGGASGPIGGCRDESRTVNPD